MESQLILNTKIVHCNAHYIYNELGHRERKKERESEREEGEREE